jgi:hypothetical protein
VYRNVRCGLAHAYMIEGNASIIIQGGNCGILYDGISDSYTFYVRRYYEDFKTAVNEYIEGLEHGREDITKFKQALETKPELI